jgi:hypothetical protein
MRTSQNTTVILLAVMVAMVLTALAWFFFLQPRMNATSTANAAKATQVVQNADLTVQLKKRKADFERLPEFKAQVWAIRDEMPPKEDADAVRDTLKSLGVKYGLDVQNDAIGVATEVVPGLVLADAFAPYGMESYVDTLKFTGLAPVPVSVTVQGSYAAVVAYLDDLQVGDHRYFLISSLTFTAMTPDPAAIPPVQPGDVELQASGYFFVLDHGVPDITERPAADPMPGSVPLPGEGVPAPSQDRTFLIPAG